MEILGEYRAKLDQCEGLCRRNSMLEAFIDTWSKRLAEGKHLSGKTLSFPSTLEFTKDVSMLFWYDWTAVLK